MASPLVRRPLRYPLPRLNDPVQPFEHFLNRGDLSHIGDGGFLDGHGFAFGALVAAHLSLGLQSRVPFMLRKDRRALPFFA